APHARPRRKRRHLSGRWALGADDRRQIAAAIAMHEIVVGGVAALFDDARGIDEALRQRARSDRAGNGLKRSIRRGVQVAIERSRLGFDRKAAQYLAGIVPPCSGQLAENEVAGLDLAS